MSEAPNIWTPIYWSDWMKDTAMCSLQEHGAYFMLLKEYWNNGGAITDDKTRIYRSCGAQTRSEKESINYILETYFLHENCKYQHKRIDAEISSALKNKRIHKERSEKANAAKASYKESSKASSKAPPSPSPTPIEEKEIPKGIPKKGDLDSKKFEVPDWIPKEEWNEYLKVRKQKKMAVTDYALNLLVGKLETFKGQGEDLSEVLNQAILGTWKSVYSLKGKDHGNTSSRNKPTTDFAEQDYGAGLEGFAQA